MTLHFSYKLSAQLTSGPDEVVPISAVETNVVVVYVSVVVKFITDDAYDALHPEIGTVGNAGLQDLTLFT